LAGSWLLANKKGKSKVWIAPIVDHDTQSIRYEIREGGIPQERTVDRGNGTCIATGSAMPAKYLREEAKAGRVGQDLIAVIAEGVGGRHYGPPTQSQREAADVPEPSWRPTQLVPERNHDVDRLPMYGMTSWGEAFTPRQLTAMTTFSDLIGDVRERVVKDALAAGLAGDDTPLREGGRGAVAYGDAVATYLALAVDRLADRSSSVCSWDSGYVKIRNTFGRQAISMSWDFAEGNPFSASTGSWSGMVGWVRKAVEHLPATSLPGEVRQRDARARVREVAPVAISTDPPYYDNISYADVSDFFYVWLRRNLASVWPDECATLLTPKSDELIANQYRAGSKAKAEEHFESGMAEFMAEVAAAQCSDVPATIYYAYKATETKDGEIRSTGWDTFLQGVLDAGLQVNATWPMRTELGNRLLASKSNALASSIVLVCRPRAASAPLASRGEFISTLREELPEAVRVLQSGNIAPVDIAQSTIGPGIKVFSRYAKVVEADGSAMSVSDALAIINDVLGEVIDGEEAELDADTRFAATWYAQHGYNPGKSGDADGQARAKNTSLSGIEASGVGEARGGTFRLFERSELDPDWDVVADDRLTVWEATQHLVAALERSESEAADLLHRLGGYGDRARQLAYVLFQKATDKGWAEEAGAYNGLILAWPTLQSMGSAVDRDQQGTLL